MGKTFFTSCAIYGMIQYLFTANGFPPGRSGW